MVVQHNLTAMNASRMLGITTGQQAKSSEKLSSGYRINRAADDAAGLSISEKMRKQINGLDQASTNAQDGVSSVQTAEGALTEVHSMLQRMNELAVQAANGTNSESDRDAIQAEIKQLTTEIDRVAETTKFNETYLLKGDAEKEQVEITTYRAPQMSLVEAAMAEGGKLEVKTDMDGTGATVYTFESGLAEGDKWNGLDVVTTVDGPNQITVASAQEEELAAMQKVMDTYYEEMGLSGTVAISTAAAGFTVQSEDDVFTYNDALDLSIHVGADSDSANKIFMKIESMDASSLGIKDLRVDGVTYARATAAIDKIADAIQKVSTQRSDLGAIQNRLEHTIANLDNVVENTTAAESRIRDTDMAEEMVEYSKNNILAQAGQSMLAQANQSTQGVLSLLQ